VFKRKAALAQARRPCESSASAEERLQKSVLTEARELIHGVLACINGIKSNPEVAKMLRKTVAAASFSASNRRRRVVTGLAIFAAVLAAVMSGSPRAGAVLPPPDGGGCVLQGPGPYYGVAYWFDTEYDQGGSSVQMPVSSIGVSGASNGSHVNQTLWMGANGATQLQNFIELGYIKSIDCTTNLEFYWAEYPPGGPFVYHKITQFTPVVGDTYTMKIAFVGNNTWNVIIDGTLVDQATDMPGNSYSMETGVESTSTSNYLPNGQSNDMSNRTSGTWTTYWGGGTDLESTNPGCTHASWGTVNLNLNDGIYGC